MRVTLRLNDQQLAALAPLGGPEELGLMVAAAIADDAARPRDERRRAPRPPGREPRPPSPTARVDEVVGAGTGLGVALAEGDVVRVEQVVDGQCADLNAFALDGARQRFDAARTRAAHGLRISTGAVLWSVPPEVELLEIVADSAGPHDLGFPACSAFEFEQITGQRDHSNCVELQRETQRHWGLAPHQLHDPLNLWLPTDVLPDGRLCFWPAACRRGDFVELRARRDVLVTVNPCASDVYGSASWELRGIRVVVEPATAGRPAPAAPTGPPPRWRWRDLPVHELPVDVDDASARHVRRARDQGWLGVTDAEVVRAMLLRWWERQTLHLGDVSR